MKVLAPTRSHPADELRLEVDSHREARERAEAMSARADSEHRTLQSELEATHAALCSAQEPQPESQLGVEPHVPTPPSEQQHTPQWSLDMERSSAPELLREPPSATTEEVESGALRPVWENQRRSLVPMFGSADYSATRLGKNDRAAWSYEDGQVTDSQRRS
eukprot:COSAG01_NODE_1971_length_8759_cov_19.618014_8_plen_162_part_00